MRGHSSEEQLYLGWYSGLGGFTLLLADIDFGRRPSLMCEKGLLEQQSLQGSLDVGLDDRIPQKVHLERSMLRNEWYLVWS